jgi:hypothetical protein
MKMGEGIIVDGWGPRPRWGVYAALLLTSAALLTLEISLTRFFSFTIWYHFAYLTISVALLGFGSSGAIIAAFPDLLVRRGQNFLVGTLVVAAALTIGGLAFLAQYPLEIHNLMSRPLRFSLSLLVYYGIVGAPFLFAGFSISVPFAVYPRLMGRLYFWDLLGAASGCALVVILIEVLGVPGLIFAAGGLMLASAAALSWAGGRKGSGLVLTALATLAVLGAGPAANRLPISITSSKNMTKMKVATPGTPPFEERSDSFTKWTVLNRVDAFGWDYPSNIAYWPSIGQNNDWTGPHPSAARLTYDGDNGSDVYSYHGDIDDEFQFLDHHVLRLPYLVLEQPKVLAIGVGGGIDLFNAIKRQARHVTGAELQPETVNLLQNRLREFTGGFYDRDDVTLVASEGRHFVRKTDEIFDLVQITAVDTFAAQATGAYVLAESYLYTVEAMEDYCRHLSPDGMVTTVVGDILFKDGLPPLATRLALIGYRALERQGVADPWNHIIVVGSIKKGQYAQTGVVLVRKTAFAPQDVTRIRKFVADNGFNLLYVPGPGSYQMSVILGPSESARRHVVDSEWFNVDATYDGNPFFYNVGKWKNFAPEKSTYFITPGSYMGQMVLVLMVLQSLFLGAILVILPLLCGAREGLRAPRIISYLSYFLALGVGFMFIEISFVQSFVLFLGSPTYALSVTIFALLLFSGVGSFLSERFVERPEWALRRLALVVAVLVTTYAFGLSLVFDAALHLDLSLRIFIAVVAQMPIGLTLGMFMPLGIACVAREHPRIVPWAWGINGVGSVIGTTLAVLLAMASSFTVVALSAVALYLLGTTMLVRTKASAAA